MKALIAGAGVALCLAMLAPPLAAQTAPETLLNQAMLLGPARMEDADGHLTLFGESGNSSYVATASGPDCRSAGTACDAIEFQALAPPADPEALAAWRADGLGGTVTQGPDGWMVLTSTARLGDDPAVAFLDWGALLAEFSARFN